MLKNGWVEETGKKVHYVNGIVNNDNGPAIELFDGAKFWYINGFLHREDGPAIHRAACVKGIRYWYLNGEELSEEEFLSRTNSGKDYEGKTVEIDGVSYELKRVK